MKETARQNAPIAAALRVKDLALDLAGEVADGYRKSSRFLRMRAAILGGWALLSLATMWLACPSSEPSNTLGARAQIQETLLGTQVAVENGSSELWTEVTLTLDGAWHWSTPTFRGGQRLVVAASSFAGEKGQAPGDLKPRTLGIRCAQGKATIALGSTP